MIFSFSMNTEDGDVQPTGLAAGVAVAAGAGEAGVPEVVQGLALGK